MFTILSAIGEFIRNCSVFFLSFMLVLNLFSMFLFAYDKYCAKKGKRRIPESLLLSITALFGGVGAFFGMVIFRHKTKHISFLTAVPLLALFQLLFIGFAVFGTL